MADERPSFTLDQGAPARAELPLGGWAAAAAGIGVTTGALVGSQVCSPNAICSVPSAAPFIAVACAAGAIAWLALPLERGGEAPVRWAAVFAIVAGALLAAAIEMPGVSLFGLLAFAAGGAAAPCAMLPAIRPDASLTLVGQDARPPRRWLQSGALPSAAIIAGLGVGAFAPRALLAGPALLVLAGLIVLGLASVPEPRKNPDAGPRQRRLRAVVRMTPMLRHATVADASVAFMLSGCAAGFAGTRFSVDAMAFAGGALALGGAVGAFGWTLAAPRADAAWGRGALLTLSFLAACAAPLALLGGLSPSGAPLLLVAGALAAFALGSATQRYALLFDLAASRGRARIAGDLQALKLIAAAAGPLAVAGVERVAPGLGLVVLSAVGFVALSTFAPTLGSLGRRTT